ncbi:MAG: NUMOD3 domain-containing DNA-binding protein [Legionella sp.]|uniref:NUMOD3 domain-containing DNA-binding protein n=1 Tax=Legionella sp. TaxID=459 RepID=UPI00284C729B|nr:NUMOD3 domain-containing DNA-binding protein [Legionella sp.]
MRNSYRRRPEDFKRRILTNNILDRKQTLIIENRWLQLIKDEELGKRYYNLRNLDFNHWTTEEDKLLTVGQKISKSHKENPNWGSWCKGRKASEEEKEKHRKPRSEETKEKISKSCSGKVHTEEMNKKKSERQTGKKRGPMTEEQKQKISKSLTGKISPIKGIPKSEEHKRKISETLKKENYNEW